jgi:(5-formylfuran-3-yl)methyl phosphate synthase
MLASVTNEREARLVASLGADIIDAKDPLAGALGALPAAAVSAIRKAVPRGIPVSATIGDPVDDVEATVAAVQRMAAAGADIVKIGLSRAAYSERVLEAAGRLDLGEARLVGVLLADEGIALELVAPARAAGFAGLMLDTADKHRGSLPDVVSADDLRHFVSAAQSAGLFAGLAGSLRAEHVPQLLRVAPDVLGFRGGLCRQGERTSEIDPDAVRKVRSVIPVCAAAQVDACRVPPPGAMARR